MQSNSITPQPKEQVDYTNYLIPLENYSLTLEIDGNLNVDTIIDALTGVKGLIKQSVLLTNEATGSRISYKTVSIKEITKGSLKIDFKNLSCEISPEFIKTLNNMETSTMLIAALSVAVFISVYAAGKILPALIQQSSEKYKARAMQDVEMAKINASQEIKQSKADADNELKRAQAEKIKAETERIKEECKARERANKNVNDAEFEVVSKDIDAYVDTLVVEISKDSRKKIVHDTTNSLHKLLHAGGQMATAVSLGYKNEGDEIEQKTDLIEPEAIPSIPNLGQWLVASEKAEDIRSASLKLVRSDKDKSVEKAMSCKLIDIDNKWGPTVPLTVKNMNELDTLNNLFGKEYIVADVTAHYSLKDGKQTLKSLEFEKLIHPL